MKETSMGSSKIQALEQPEDVLTKTAFHRVLLLFHQPAFWPTWKVALLCLVMVGGSGVVWLLLTGEVLASALVALITSIFLLIDATILRALPGRRISYGPWQSQLLALAIPRTLAAVVVSIFAYFTNTAWGLAGLTFLELVGTAAYAWGLIVEPFRLRTSYLTIESDHLKPSRPPIRILHISDLHIERCTRRESKLLELVENENADLILITGDFLNLSYTRDPKAHEDARKLLAQLSAPMGIYASLGSPPVDERDVIPAIFKGLPIEFLVNRWTKVQSEGGQEVILLGLDCTHHLAIDVENLDKLISISPNSMPRILLYHAPDLMPQAAEHEIELYLCGHTHGGQVRLPFIGALLTSSQLGKRYEMGLYKEGRTRMYVSRGVGLEGLSAPRVRFMSPPEITLITLQGSSQDAATRLS